MKISVIGSGYVGLSTAVGFALKGHGVICVDIVKEKVDSINLGIPTMYEKGMDEALKKVAGKNLSATTDAEKAVLETDISFICVGTPDKNGEQDLGFVKGVSEDIGKAIGGKEGYHLVAVKSTVVPGTAGKTVLPILEKISGKKCGEAFGLCSNPEFLQEGRALEGFLNPDRIVIGEFDFKSGNVLGSLYTGFNSPVIKTDLATAEMIKYASNIFLASKITIINEIGNICKKFGVDSNKVSEAMGLDKRIGKYFLDAGCGFGGSCFGKDTTALLSAASKAGYSAELLKKMLETNERQKLVVVDQLEAKIGSLEGKRIAVLGLAFKPETDDIRDAPSISVINKLLGAGATVRAYDPKAMENMKKVYPQIYYFPSASRALKGADACLILAEWPEFTNLTNGDFACMKQKIIIEGRRVLDRSAVSCFEGICW